jgi:Uncharacterized alpha/beta hydrolase domain (DUF2235)
MTRLIVCCDGTWNTPDQRENGVPAPTNVAKFFNALAPEDADRAPQRKYYHPGVGTDGSHWERLVAGGLGKGLDQNVKSAYRWLASNCEPDARIHLIGFSRGAYTARSVGGMIARCGLLDLRPRDGLTEAAAWEAVDAIFRRYRAKDETVTATPELRFHNAREGERTKGTTSIFFIGVWDTVGSLGIPDDLALLNLLDDPQDHAFHDCRLSSKVEHARHAVAMDERRHSFMPTLWTNRDEAADMKQVWFPGVHGDVGGGYARSELSSGALLWMMEEARELGVGFRPGLIESLKPDPLGVLHDSLTGIFARLKKRPRAVPRVHADEIGKRLHRSVLDRNGGASFDHADYWATRALEAGKPVQCDIFAREPWNVTGLYLEEGVSYDFAASGEWMDGTVKCGPGGTDDDRFEIGEIAHVAASLIDRAEAIFRRLSNNQQAELWWSRREGDQPWFALIGVVANEEDPEERITYQTFAIGEGTRFRPTRTGYLYCFANDAWEAYGNNRGSVRLTVRVADAAQAVAGSEPALERAGAG